MKFFIAISVALVVIFLGVTILSDQKNDVSQANATQEKHILVSLHPLAMITTALIEGIETAHVDVMLPSGASPHTYALKPSDMQMLQRADLVIWVGENLETFLNKPLQQHKHVLTLSTVEGMPLRQYTSKHEHAHDKYANEEKKRHQNDEHKHDSPHKDEDDHCCDNHQGIDLHLWLGVPQVRVIAKSIFEHLQSVFPSEQEKLQANYTQFNTLLTQTDKTCAQRLSKLHNIGYFVFHDAYGYWQDHYDLPSAGYFTVSPERQMGAKHLDEIRKKLLEKDAECVFAEPQFQSAILRTISEETKARVGILDPIGQNINLSTTSYFEFMLDLTERFEHCLSPNTKSE